MMLQRKLFIASEKCNFKGNIIQQLILFQAFYELKTLKSYIIISLLSLGLT